MENQKSGKPNNLSYLNYRQNVEKFLSSPNHSREMLVAKAILPSLLQNRGEPLFETEETIQQIREAIQKHPRAKSFSKRVSFEDLIQTLRKSEILLKVPQKGGERGQVKPEVPHVDYHEEIHLEKPRVLETINIQDKEKKRKGIRKERIKELFERVLDRETSSWEYFQQFVQAGLVSEAEARRDYERLQEIKQDIEKRRENQDTKQLAVLSERGIEALVSHFHIFGDRVFMYHTSEFDDILRGVDSLIEIFKEDDESDFVGVSADVTFRRLNENSFAEKFFLLLRSIREGKKTRVKYEKNAKGELLKEFIVPKVLLHFELEDVRFLVRVLDAFFSPEKKEEILQEIREKKVGKGYLKQIITQCKLLSAYAKKYENNIFRRYDTVLNSLIELSWKEPIIREALEESDEATPFHTRLEELIHFFDSQEKRV